MCFRGEWTIDRGGDFSIYLLHLKNFSILLGKLGRRQRYVLNLNGPLLIVQIFVEEGEKQRLFHRIAAVPIIT